MTIAARFRKPRPSPHRHRSVALAAKLYVAVPSPWAGFGGDE